MARNFGDIAFTDSVRRAQRRYLGREVGAARVARDTLGAREADFIAARDSFYLATVGENGWPYVQHRGGPAGFLRAIDGKRIAFADYGGNRQFVTVGNLDHDARVALILVDYPTRRRLKIYGRARVVGMEDAPPELLAPAQPAQAAPPAERLVAIEVETFDWNCSQHITPRYTESEWRDRLARPDTTDPTRRQE